MTLSAQPAAAPVTRGKLTEAERDRLLSSHLYLADFLANTFQRRGVPVPWDQLHAAALEGIALALDRFDPRRGVSFKTVAYRVAWGECSHLCRYLKRQGIRNAPEDLETRVLSLDELRPTGLTSDGDTLAESLVDPSASPEDQAVGCLQAARITAALHQLPDVQAYLVRAVVMDEETITTAAREWEIGPDRARAELMAGCAALRDLLAELDPDRSAD